MALKLPGICTVSSNAPEQAEHSLRSTNVAGLQHAPAAALLRLVDLDVAHVQRIHVLRQATARDAQRWDA